MRGCDTHIPALRTDTLIYGRHSSETMTRIADVIVPFLATVFLMMDLHSTKCEGRIGIQKLECVLDTSECLLKVSGRVVRDDLDWMRENATTRGRFFPMRARGNRNLLLPACGPLTSPCCERAFQEYSIIFGQDLSDDLQDRLTAECQLYYCDPRGKKVVTCTHVGCRYPGCMSTTTTSTTTTTTTTATNTRKSTTTTTTTRTPPTTTTTPVSSNDSSLADTINGSDADSDVWKAVVGPLVAVFLVAVIAAVLGYIWWRRKKASKNRAGGNGIRAANVAKKTILPAFKIPKFNQMKDNQSGAANGDVPFNSQSQHDYTYIDGSVNSRPKSFIGDATDESVYSELDDVAMRYATPSDAGSARKLPAAAEDALGYLVPSVHETAKPSAPLPSVYSLAAHNAAFVGDESSVPQPSVSTEKTVSTTGQKQSKNGLLNPLAHPATGTVNSTDGFMHMGVKDTGRATSSVSSITKHGNHDYSALDLSAMTDNSCGPDTDYTPLDHSPRPSPKPAHTTQPQTTNKTKPKVAPKNVGLNSAKSNAGRGTNQNGSGPYFLLEEGAAGRYSLAQDPNNVSTEGASQTRPSASKLYNHIDTAGEDKKATNDAGYNRLGVDKTVASKTDNSDTAKIPEYLEIVSEYSLQKHV